MYTTRSSSNSSSKYCSSNKKDFAKILSFFSANHRVVNTKLCSQSVWHTLLADKGKSSRKVTSMTASESLRFHFHFRFRSTSMKVRVVQLILHVCVYVTQQNALTNIHQKSINADNDLSYSFICVCMIDSCPPIDIYQKMENAIEGYI
uniref:Uncharacterized protein n=1 Tax=Glossina pallidipes TaxID=7398 RepID=A0A1B0AAN7_GLOPL